MPPQVKFTKKDLVQAAFDIACEKGFSGITIRSVSQKVDSSIAPIYVNFLSSKELKDTVAAKAVSVYEKLITDMETGNFAVDIEIASVLFAKRYPLLFEEIVIKRHSMFAPLERIKNYVMSQLKKDPTFSHLSSNELSLMILKRRVFLEGLCLMAYDKKYGKSLDEDVIISLLEESARDFGRFYDNDII